MSLPPSKRVAASLAFFPTFVFLLLPVCFALEFTEGDVINVRVASSVDGSGSCDAIVCNLSVLWPNASFLVENGGMDRSGCLFNRSLGVLDAQVLDAVVYCCDAGECGSSAFEIEIFSPLSPLNPDFNNPRYVLMLLFLLGGMVIPVLVGLNSPPVLIFSGLCAVALVIAAFVLHWALGLSALGGLTAVMWKFLSGVD